jgi:hypothetical protein
MPCPASSSSGVASARCTCNAGHIQTLTIGEGPFKSYTVVGVSTYRGVSDGTAIAGQFNFLTIDGYANVSVMKDTILTLTLAPFNGVQSNLWLYNPDPSMVFADSYSDPNGQVTNVRMDVMSFFFIEKTLSDPDVVASQYTSGVTGSGTSTLVFDTTGAAPGIYYLGSNGVVYSRPTLLMIQVQAPVPVTLSVATPNMNTAYIATYGDTLVVARPNSIQYLFRIYCTPETDTVDGNPLQFMIAESDGPPITWDTTGLQTGIQCWIIDDSSYSSAYNNIFFKQRLPPIRPAGVTLTCTACPVGYRSNNGDDHCTPCGVGSYSNVSNSSTCSLCAIGTYSPIYNASACLQCPAGQFSKATGASACANCTQCTASKLGGITKATCLQGSTADTGNCSCASGYYGTGIVLGSMPGCTPCPANTNSTEDSRLLLHCKCKPGYSCSYTKRIDITIHVANMTLTSFNNTFMSTFIAAIAKAANVSVSQVHISSAVVSRGGARRGLLPSKRTSRSSTLVVQFQVRGGEHLDADALRAHSLVQKLTWQHAHHVHVRRQMLQSMVLSSSSS